jgi:hypothetical protein
MSVKNELTYIESLKVMDVPPLFWQSKARDGESFKAVG